MITLAFLLIAALAFSREPWYDTDWDKTIGVLAVIAAIGSLFV